MDTTDSLVVSVRLDRELAEVLAALGHGQRGTYLRGLLRQHVAISRRGCVHDRTWRGRCARCGARLKSQPIAG
jgi:hypothetical protein